MGNFKRVLTFLLCASLALALCYTEKDFWEHLSSEIGARTLNELLWQKTEVLNIRKKDSAIQQQKTKNEVVVYACGRYDQHALKVVSEPKYQNGHALAREAHFYSLLQDIPNIPRIYGCYYGNGKGGMLMMRLGETLEDLQMTITEQRSPQRAKIFLDLALMANQMHKKKICHNDFKPNNIVSIEGRRLDFTYIDFDYSCTFSTPCRNSHKAYSAPEVYEELQIDNYYHRCQPSIDVWALTLVILYVESHEVSFNYPLQYTLCKEITYACLKDFFNTIERYSNVEPEYLELIMRVLRSPLAERNSMEVLINPLRNMAQGKPPYGPNSQVINSSRGTTVQNYPAPITKRSQKRKKSSKKPKIYNIGDRTFQITKMK